MACPCHRGMHQHLFEHEYELWWYGVMPMTLQHTQVDLLVIAVGFECLGNT